MRMWMVDPALMCQKHLLGEHVEMHMFVGTLRNGVSVKGYVDNGLMEPTKLRDRHDALAAEMERRGMNHKSPLKRYHLTNQTEEEINATVDAKESIQELMRRCPDCRHKLQDAGYSLNRELNS